MFSPNHKKQKNIKGFTLIELLVVIGIIAILASMSIVSYNTAQKKARDTKRISDITDIQNALEQYYTICSNKYATPASGGNFTSIICTTPSVAIMPTVPKDPFGSPYPCQGCNDSKYTICTPTVMELQPTVCVSNRQ
ncbi:MAG: hypothetical protein KatS3mg090_0914 [Patescibacteria group bacterium]|nr:MAG: hypothetical protein KatS3mg090_0914 [Patescibacteria group bacterium]